MNKKDIIEEKIKEFIKKDALFTSVDIANSIKRDGIWVRNIEVRDWLKQNSHNDDFFGEYETEVIEVYSGTRVATLYRPTWTDASDYEERDQTAITPNEVNAIKGHTTPNNDDLIEEEKEEEDIINLVIPKGVSVRRKIYSKERIKIPGVIIKKMGLNPGDTVDPNIIKTHRPVPRKLRVNSDYRISIPRSCVNWGKAPIIVMLKNKKIIFEKA